MKTIDGHDVDTLLKKCEQFKQGDGESWFIADVFEKWLHSRIKDHKPPCPICNAPTTIIHEKLYCINEDCHHYYNPIEQKD
jgi:hypothetical protein